MVNFPMNAVLFPNLAKMNLKQRVLLYLSLLHVQMAVTHQRLFRTMKIYCSTVIDLAGQEQLKKLCAQQCVQVAWAAASDHLVSSFPFRPIVVFVMKEMGV